MRCTAKSVNDLPAEGRAPKHTNPVNRTQRHSRLLGEEMLETLSLDNRGRQRLAAIEGILLEVGTLFEQCLVGC